MKTIILTILLALVSIPASATETVSIPPGAEQAKERLNTTPRHGEQVEVQVPGTETKLKAWIVYPERSEKAPVIIVIHEIYGLSDWIRTVADQLAADGFIAIAPDLVTGKGPGGGGSESFPDRDSITKAVRALSEDEVTSGLNAIRDYGKKLPSSNGKFATVGFCWGGTTSFRYATLEAELSAAVVYYGSSPESGMENIKAPVLGMYGENDNRVNATIEPAKTKMAELKKSYTPRIHPGAGHGFLRQQDGQNGANLQAAQNAWPETIQFLKKATAP